MSGEVGLAGVKLAPLAGAYDLAGVLDSGGPVKALAEHIANEGTRRLMMAADPGVDVLQELAPLGDGHAPLQDAGGGALVQFAVDEGKGSGWQFAIDEGKGPSTRSSQLWIWLAGKCSSHVRAASPRCRGKLRMMTSSLVAPPSWHARR
jgi:hypothetical protein